MTAKVGDYYAVGQTVAGEWFGKGAERLGLSGRVGESEFLRLCDNQHSSTAGPLTARLNTVRTSVGGTTANRRIFFDFTFSELAKAMRGFGYQLRNRLQGDFEIEGVSQDLCTRLSKRHAQIDQALTQLLTGKPELAGANLKDLRSRLATAERARKQKELSRPELRDLWESQTTATERQELSQLTRSGTVRGKVSRRTIAGVFRRSATVSGNSAMCPSRRLVACSQAILPRAVGSLASEQLPMAPQTAGRGRCSCKSLITRVLGSSTVEDAWNLITAISWFARNALVCGG